MAGGVLRTLGCVALTVGIQACGKAEHSAGAETGDSGDVTVSLDFAPPLSIANETLVFPLTSDPGQRTLSRTSASDFVLVYTRVGCWVDDPEAHLGGNDPVALTAGEGEELTTVTISQRVAELVPMPDPAQVAKETCVSLRPPGSTWQAFLTPTEVRTSGGSVELEFSIPMSVADAAAIFLPTYTAVERVTYTVRPL